MDSLAVGSGCKAAPVVDTTIRTVVGGERILWSPLNVRARVTDRAGHSAIQREVLASGGIGQGSLADCGPVVRNGTLNSFNWASARITKPLGNGGLFILPFWWCW